MVVRRKELQIMNLKEELEEYIRDYGNDMSVEEIEKALGVRTGRFYEGYIQLYDRMSGGGNSRDIYGYGAVTRYKEMFYALQEKGAPGRVLIEGFNKYGQSWWERVVEAMDKKAIVSLVVPPRGKGVIDRIPRTTIPSLVCRDMTVEEESLITDPISRGYWLVKVVLNSLGLRRRMEVLSTVDKWGNDDRNILRYMTKKECKKVAKHLMSGRIGVLQTVDVMTTIMALATRVMKHPDIVPGQGIENIVGIINKLPDKKKRHDTHTLQGITTSGGGITSIGDINMRFPSREEHRVTYWKEAAKVMSRIEGDITADGLDIGGANIDENGNSVNRERIKLSSGRAQQVLVFRVGRGRTLYIDKAYRYMEFGPSIVSNTWSNAYIGGGGIIRIIGASALGLPSTWGWNVFIHSNRGVIVVPDKEWDSMIWLWEKDIVLWPHIVEAGGMHSQMPGWNGGGLGFCFGGQHGNADYPEYAIGKLYVDGRLHSGLPNQPRRAKRIQEVLIANEGNRCGEMEVYVPKGSFRFRLKRIKSAMQQYNKVGGDVYVATLIKVIGQEMGALCVYNGYRSMIWQTVYHGKKSGTWWWQTRLPQYKGNMGIQVPVKGEGYPGLKDIKDELERRGLGTSDSSVYAYRMVKHKNDRSIERGGNPLSRYRIWELAYKGVYGVASEGGLMAMREATDGQKSGEDLRQSLGGGGVKPLKEQPERIVGKTPVMSEGEKKRARADDSIVKRRWIVPVCGVDDCTDANCLQIW